MSHAHRPFAIWEWILAATRRPVFEPSEAPADGDAYVPVNPRLRLSAAAKYGEGSFT